MSHRIQSLPIPVIPRKEFNTMETNTDTINNNIVLMNAEKKKKPHNISFKNFNPNEPKIHQINTKYSDKQKYRRFKTRIEPKLHQKIMVDDEEDLIAKIRKEFGIEDKTKKNYSEVETSGTPYYETPNPKPAPPEARVRYNKKDLSNEISDIPRDESESLQGGLLSFLVEAVNIYGRQRLAAMRDADEEIERDALDYRRAIESPGASPPEALSRARSTFTEATELSTAATAAQGTAADIEDLRLELQRRGIPQIRGPMPKSPYAIRARIGVLQKRIREFDKARGAAP
jgi:hypothetical protein